MRDLEYDAVVVGGGPAGSIAARTLAEKGVKTLVLDKRQEIGTPKRCAEAINGSGLRRVGLVPDPRWAVQTINGSVLYAPGGKSVKLVFDDRVGYVLERKIFEKFLAADAISRGAKYMVKTLVTGVIKEDGRVAGVEANFMGEDYRIRSRLVIAADGVDSMVAKSAGLKTVNSLTDYHSGFQYEMAGLKIDGENLLHIFLGDENAPKGYVWIFPKGNGVGNVGIGILGKLSVPGRKAQYYLDRFIESRPDIFSGASPIEVNSGGIPVGSAIDCLVADGLMVVGDAAHQVNPIHGGGISMAMNAARIAGVVGAKALSEGVVSRERLLEYDTLWRAGDGVKAQKLLKLRSFMEKLDADDLDTLADILESDEVTRIVEGEYGFLVKKFLKKAPSILPLAKKFLI